MSSRAGQRNLLMVGVRRMVRPVASCGSNRKSPAVPVDTPPPARVAGPIPHYRKLAFLAGAVATVLAIMLVNQVIGMMP